MHAAERSIRYGKKLSNDQCNIIGQKIKNGLHVQLRAEKYGDIIHTIVSYSGINYLVIYDTHYNNLITMLPPSGIKNSDYIDHDYFYRDGKIIHFNELINRIYFSIYREYM